MPDLNDIYREVILDHSKNPRNRRAIPGNCHTADGNNPLCGDRITMYLVLDGDVIRDLSFEGDGCAISVSSASMMTEHLKGKTVEEAEEIFGKFHEMLTGDTESEEIASGIGKLAAFHGVRQFPIRVKCATLAWHTLRAALIGSGESVTTE